MSDDLSKLPPLRETIARHGLQARKGLGQHFLLDLNLTGRIARTAGSLTEGTVIEVGPGPGGLTRALLAEGALRLIVIERDSRCLEALKELQQQAGGRLEIIAGDALETDIAALGTQPRRLVSNLPYNISTALLIGWLKSLAEDPGVFGEMVLMFQKEVAQRLAAGPGNKDYGRLSVLTQWLCEVRPAFDVAPRAFTPPPKVQSSVVVITPRPEPLAPASLRNLEQVTAAAFGQRRKMLRQSLKSLGGDPASLLEATGVSATARAEELSVEEFCALARVLAQR